VIVMYVQVSVRKEVLAVSAVLSRGGIMSGPSAFRPLRTGTLLVEMRKTIRMELRADLRSLQNRR
jgi:hypothetical protein